MDKIICLGKNYPEHARELGDTVPEYPVVFLKPPSVLKSASRIGEKISVRFPQGAGAVHHECEIVLRLSAGGQNLSLQQALEAIEAVTVGLDMTLRERQTRLKQQGHPWTISKVFPDAAIVGPWCPVTQFPDWEKCPFSLWVEGVLRQKGQAQEMVHSPAQCLSYLSGFFPLCPGDLVFTGTPAGVGPVAPGQVGRLEWGKIHFEVAWQ